MTTLHTLSDQSHIDGPWGFIVAALIVCAIGIACYVRHVRAIDARIVRDLRALRQAKTNDRRDASDWRGGAA